MNWVENTSKSSADDAARVEINVTSAQDLLADIAGRFKAGQGYTVATLNLDHVVKLRRDPVFRHAYARHSHVTADGNPIVWLSRLAGQHITLTSGSDLLDPLCDLAAREGMRLAFFGSMQDVLDKATAELVARHPGLDVVLALSPAMGFDPQGVEAEAALRRLADAKADLILVALGAPKQEIFAAFAAEALPRAGFISIGASLDFVTGHQLRAPRLLRLFALEWLWRLVLSPGRLTQRYLECFALLPGLAGQALTVRQAAGKDLSS